MNQLNYQELYGLWGEKSDPELPPLLLPYMDLIVCPKSHDLCKNGDFAHWSAWYAFQSYMAVFWSDSHCKKRSADEIIRGIADHIRLQEREVKKVYEQTNLCRGNTLKEVGRRMNKVHMMEYMRQRVLTLSQEDCVDLIQAKLFTRNCLQKMQDRAFWTDDYKTVARFFKATLDGEKLLIKKMGAR